MKYFTGISADSVWQKAAQELISNHDYRHDGNNGETLEILPCVLRVTNPRLRWIQSRRPPYNPAFGLVEFIWILAGKDESLVPKFWNPALYKYSGNDEHFYGAYGYRLRKHLGFDQIKRAFEVLKSFPETRQAVLQIWDSNNDLPYENGKPRSKDIPCNLMSLLKIRDNKLHWTQIMRSNDIMLGLPYNFIQFTMLQEVMAGWLECDIGEYFHLSDSLHVYTDDLKRYEVDLNNKYVGKVAPRFDMSFEQTEQEIALIYADLEKIAKGEVTSKDELRSMFSKDTSNNQLRCKYLQDIVVIIGADAARRLNHKGLADEFIDSCTDEGLQLAAKQWFQHKENSK